MVRSLLGTAVGVVFLLLTWRALGHISWRGIDFQPGAVALAFVGALGFLGARAWRYRLLLPDSRSAGSQVLGVTAISWAVGLLVPGPSADASFIALSPRVLGAGAARATGVSLVARLLDVASLGVVAVIAGSLSEAGESLAVLIAAAVVGLVSAGLLVVLFTERPRAALLGWASRRPRLARWSERAERSLAALSGRSRGAMLLGSTALCRICTAIEYAALFSLIDLHLPFWDIWFALSIRSFLTAIPIQGIAGIGTSQAWWTTALVLDGVAAGPAVAASVTLQVLDLAVALSLSAVVAAATAGSWRRRSEGAAAVAEVPVSAELVAHRRSYAARATSR